MYYRSGQCNSLCRLKRCVKEIVCVAVRVLLPNVRLGLIVRALLGMLVGVQLQQQFIWGHDPREQQQQKQGAIPGKVFHWQLKNGQIYKLFEGAYKCPSCKTDNLSFLLRLEQLLPTENCWLC